MTRYVIQLQTGTTSHMYTVPDDLACQSPMVGRYYHLHLPSSAAYVSNLLPFARLSESFFTRRIYELVLSGCPRRNDTLNDIFFSRHGHVMSEVVLTDDPPLLTPHAVATKAQQGYSILFAWPRFSIFNVSTTDSFPRVM